MPHDSVNGLIGQEVLGAPSPLVAHAGQRVRERLRGHPGLRKHHMQGHAQRLRAVDVPISDGVRYDCVGNKLLLRAVQRIRVDACAPARVDDLVHHRHILRDLTERLSRRGHDKSSRLNHELRQDMWVSAQREELQAALLDDKLAEVAVGSEAYAVPVSLEFLPQQDEGLYISPSKIEQIIGIIDIEIIGSCNPYFLLTSSPPP